MKWEKNISRGGGWKLKPSHKVCELHFEPHFIKDIDDVILATPGSKLSISSYRKTLAEDAVPTIFNGYPSYMVPKQTTKRKAPKERHTASKVITLTL